jgi:ribosomal protein S18 acetylase RimI-like enzyme
MIEELQAKDIKQVADVYVRGLAEQNPPGEKISPEQAEEKLRHKSCLVYKTGGVIEGLLLFSISDPRTITIDFICSLKHRRGVGSELLRYLAEHSGKEGIKYIHSTVSTWDKRAMDFYKHCGFKKYGERLEEHGGQDFLLDKVRAVPDEIVKALTPANQPHC